MRVTAAFIAHELRTQGRSLRFRTFAALYVAVGSLPGVLVYLRRSDAPFAVGGATYAFETMNALPLLTALFAFLLSLDGISREQGEGAWTTVTLCGMSNAGYLLRRWLALLAVILPLTAIPLVTAAIAAAIALSAQGGPGVPNLWLFGGPWLVQVLPLAVVSSAFGLGIGTIGGGALGALPLLGTALALVPMLGNQVAHRFGLRFSSPLVWLDQAPAGWMLNRAAQPLARRNPYGWDFPLPTSEAGFDLRVLGEQHLADGAFLGALAALSLGVAAVYLRRTRADVRPRRVGPKHPFRGFLLAYVRTLEHYKPDPAPAPADRLAVVCGVLAAIVLTGLMFHRGRHYESLALARVAAEAQEGPAPSPVGVVPGRWRIEGRVGMGMSDGGVDLRVAAEMLNQGKEPAGHLAFQLNPELQMEVTADAGRVSAARTWDRLGLVLEPPIPPGGRRELRFRLTGEPSRPVFPVRGEGSFAQRLAEHRNARFGHDRLILSRSFREPSISGFRISLQQEDLIPLPRYAPWRGEDGTATETVFPLAQVELSITGPPDVFLADSCGGIAGVAAIAGTAPGERSAGRLASRCQIALADLAVVGGHQRLLSVRDDAGTPSPIAFAVFPAHAQAAELHMGALVHSAGQLEAAWPGFGSFGRLAVVEWPHPYVHNRNAGMYFLGWWRGPFDSFLTVKGNLAFLDESDVTEIRPMRPEYLVAEILSVRLAGRRRVVPEHDLFFRQLFRNLALERLGLGPENGAVVGPLHPAEEAAVQVPALGASSWSYWRRRFPAIVAALESRIGSEALRLAVEEFLAKGEDSGQPPGTAEELIALLARHSSQPAERLLQDALVAGDLPYPVLDGVEFRRVANDWRVTGRVVNQGKGEALCKVVLTTDFGPEEAMVRADSGESASFVLSTRHRPQGVFLDPRHECHRLLKMFPPDRAYFEGGGT